MVFYAAFNSISVISLRQLTLFMSFLGFTSTRLGSEVSCPRTLQRKNPEDPVRLEPRTPGLRVKHFTTELRGTQINDIHVNQFYEDRLAVAAPINSVFINGRPSMAAGVRLINME